MSSTWICDYEKAASDFYILAGALGVAPAASALSHFLQ
jgi:hypothetical protein